MRETYARIAVPRLPGSTRLRDVEETIATHLRGWGYEVARRPFDASPARLGIVGAAGASLTAVALASIPLLASAAPRGIVAASWLGGCALAVWAAIAGLRAASLPVVEAANLEARRGEPRLWLVAHGDSKGQGVSLARRVVGAGCAAAGIGGLLLLAGLRLGGPLPWLVVLPVALLAGFGGLVLAQSAPRDDSPGAVDNATGIVALLVAAEVLRERSDIGIVVTGAEEFGMTGARAWMAGGRRQGAFINFDSVDGRGAFRVAVHHPRGHERPPAALALGDAVGEALAIRGPVARRVGLPFGVFVDGGVLAARGMPGVTVSRGDWQTLSVVHTPGDVASRVDIASAVDAGFAVAEAARRVVG